MTGKATKKAITQAIERVAKQLGNTVAVCRKCYIHPAVLEAFQAGKLAAPDNPAQARLPSDSARLKKEEAAVIAMLKASRKLRDSRKEENIASRLRASIRLSRGKARAKSPAAAAPALRSVS